VYSRQHPISPELLTLVRAGVPADQVRTVLESLDGSQGWEAVLAEAARQGVTPPSSTGSSNLTGNRFPPQPGSA
jgi:hypothetical protein